MEDEQIRPDLSWGEKNVISLKSTLNFTSSYPRMNTAICNSVFPNRYKKLEETFFLF